MSRLPAYPQLYRLLAIDVDGTLVNSRDELTSDTQEALIRAGRAGIHIVLATGRRYSRTLHFVEAVGDRRAADHRQRGVDQRSEASSHVAENDFDPHLLAADFEDYRGQADTMRCFVPILSATDSISTMPGTKVKNPELQEYFELQSQTTGGFGRIC